MRKLSEGMYVREDHLVLLHSHGPEGTPWCVVDVSSPGQIDSELVAMFAHLDDAIGFSDAKSVKYPDTKRISTELVEVDE